jgi:hypothetical protein
VTGCTENVGSVGMGPATGRKTVMVRVHSKGDDPIWRGPPVV